MPGHLLWWAMGHKNPYGNHEDLKRSGPFYPTFRFVMLLMLPVAVHVASVWVAIALEYGGTDFWLVRMEFALMVSGLPLAFLVAVNLAMSWYSSSRPPNLFVVWAQGII